MDQYEIVDIAGGGAYAEVYLAEDRSNNSTVALKKVCLNRSCEIKIGDLREALMLHDLKHPNIVRLERVFYHDGCLWMVLEYLAADLNVHMAWHPEKYPDKIKSFLKQILSGISYCHSLGILHRDLKPDNLLIDTTTTDNVLKLADFGMARPFVSSGARLSPEVVTLNYRAPEILLRSAQYSTPVDMWSIGCILAQMVNLAIFFEGESSTDVLLGIFSKMGTPDEETWPGVSSLPNFSHDFPKCSPKELASLVPGLDAAGVDLLSKLLCLDPNGRISARDALEHEYLKDEVASD